jgi:hypothetical protein
VQLATLSAHRSRLKPPVLTGRTGPSDTLPPTAESRRELSAAADDCLVVRSERLGDVGENERIQAAESVSRRRAARIWGAAGHPSAQTRNLAVSLGARRAVDAEHRVEAP